MKISISSINTDGTTDSFTLDVSSYSITSILDPNVAVTGPPNTVPFPDHAMTAADTLANEASVQAALDDSNSTGTVDPLSTT